MQLIQIFARRRRIVRKATITKETFRITFSLADDKCEVLTSSLIKNYQTVPVLRVSMALTVSRKTAKNLAVRREKMLTVKKSNQKTRSRDLLLSLMCYAFMSAFMCSGSQNYNRNRKCRKCLHNSPFPNTRILEMWCRK